MEKRYICIVLQAAERFYLFDKEMKKNICVGAMLVFGALFGYIELPWGIYVPAGEKADDFWCRSTREDNTIRITMDASKKRDRDTCHLIVKGRNKVFEGTNKTYRLICRQSASRPLGLAAPEIRLMDSGKETFRFAGTEVAQVGDMVVATYKFNEENKVGVTWGPKVNKKFDGDVVILSIGFPCEKSGDVWVEGFEPLDGKDYVECSECVLTMKDGFDSFTTPWNITGKAVLTNNILKASWQRSPYYISYNAFPGPKPFRGPFSISVKSKGIFKGDVTLKLKHRDSNKYVERKVPWKEESVFEFGLSSSEYYQFENISFTPGFSKTPLEVEILSITAKTLESPASAARLDIDTSSPLHILTDLEKIPCATLFNSSKQTLDWAGHIVAINYFGDTLRIPFSGKVKSGETLRIPIDVRKALPDGAVRARGIWRVAARISSGGFTDFKETRFAVLNKNEITPRLEFGTFRMGINYHFARFTQGHKNLTLDALNACGAKLVRSGGFAADYCWKSPDQEPDFSGAGKLMSMLKERGLSLNSSIWPNPKWMAPTNVQHSYKLWIRTRTKPGMMGEYAEKLARHFGSDIDYLETSNEADLWDTNTITASEYVDYQKEAYEGIKRGCPLIKVLPSAFAAADSSNAQVRRKGYQETILKEAKGYYDIHPVHMHSPFSLFEGDVLSKFFPMRRALGVDVPWYANETALTSVNGAEDIVAKNVWMKILFALAHGSTDYIWYNLKGTGWKPSDPEQGYGLLTADYYPRSGYAAFSSLAHIITGFKFNSILCEKKGRHFYSLKGLRNGKSSFVLAGWDLFTDPEFPIRIKTDAKEASVVDIMGNFYSAQKTDGGYVFPIGKNPSAILLEDATVFEVDSADIDNVPPPKINARKVKAEIEGRMPDFVLDEVWKVRELYAANPDTVERTWKGAKDLSAKIWIGRSCDELRFRFEVRDDVHSQRSPAEKLYMNDGLQFILEAPGQSGNFEFGLARTEDGKPLTKTWIVPVGFNAETVNRSLKLITSRNADTTLYDACIPMSAIGFTEETVTNGFRFNAIIYDDDGMGNSRDGWIEIAPGIAMGKDYTSAPFVKIEDKQVKQDAAK